MARTRITRQDFLAIKASFKNGLSAKEVQELHGRGESVIRQIKNARSWTAYQSANGERYNRRKGDGLLDTNLTKEQAQAYLDMQTQLETVKGERDTYKERADRYEKLNATQAATIASYQRADLDRSLKQARRNRSILAMFRRAN